MSEPRESLFRFSSQVVRELESEFVEGSASDTWRQDVVYREVFKPLRDEIARLETALRRIAYQAFDVNASAVSELANAKAIAAEAVRRRD
jgi:hypothetical protein